MKKLHPGKLCLLSVLLFPLFIQAQISGVVNQYTEVLSVDAVTNSVEVANPAMFTTTDRVMLIQMKGAQMDESNSSNFGDITNLNNAGSFEIATVCDVVGNDVLFSYEIKNSYNPSSASNPRLQLVKVYSATDETVNATLTASPWNGSTGGVLVLELSGTLTLNADIDLSGRGFRGAEAFSSTYACSFAVESNGFFYDFAGGAARGAEKGEGIANFITNKEYGKGKQISGGGGGNDHNTGGGGGSNYGTGGNGGSRTTGFFSCQGDHPGLGGSALSGQGYSVANPRVYFGGGGGAGHDNNGDADDAGDGGGIVIIIANQIEGNGNAILANGTDALITGGDGAAGGGAGGSILLSVNGYGTTALHVEATGGNGANTTINCEGPGGGGGGGAIWVSTALGGMVTSDVTGGNNGTATACAATNGATAGGNGAVLTALAIPEEIVNTSSCVLNSSIELSGRISPEKEILLNWESLPRSEYRGVELEKMNQSGNFGLLARLSPNKNRFLDRLVNTGENIYRLKLIRQDGSMSYSNPLSLILDGFSGISIALKPNPIKVGENPSLIYSIPEDGRAVVRILDMLGKEVWREELPASGGRQEISLNLPAMSRGVYLLSFRYLGIERTEKMRIE
ncbi:MAG: T9SS type A sorting domain-containing protein [Bacteroidia bacterium]|nr:T9SS type A sorting domain-containing protein [Bacteroidia bacterium]